MTTAGVLPRERVHAALIPLWRGLVVYRVVALGAAVFNLVRYAGEYARPWLGVAVVAAMAVWTAVSSVRYLRIGDRATAVADLLLTTAATASTLLIDTPERISAGGPVITTVWSAGAVLAMAVAWGWRGGLVGGAATVLVLYGVRAALDTDLAYDAQLLLVTGLAVGLAADTMRRSTLRLQAAIAREAANAERERLARDIHDDVLQVLALLRRRAEQLAPDSELTRLAGEQEVALRRLITTGPSTPGDGTTDLATALAGVLPSRASIAVPAEPVELPAPVVEELAAVAREAAANATEHAGPGAGLWVLLEEEASTVTLSVRDDGKGIPAGRLQEAADQGHLGVVSSIRGRVAALGGTASLHTSPGEGTEWEISIPREGRS